VTFTKFSKFCLDKSCSLSFTVMRPYTGAIALCIAFRPSVHRSCLTFQIRL